MVAVGMLPIFVVTLPVVFSLADRGIGGLFQRSLVIGLTLAAAIGFGLAGFGFLGLIIATWIVYRTLPWRIGGSTTPRAPAEIVGAFARHALPTVATPMAHVWFGTPWLSAIPFLVYAAFATGLAVAYARHVDDLAARGRIDDGEFNDGLELVRGLLFGLAAVWALV